MSQIAKRFGVVLTLPILLLCVGALSAERPKTVVVSINYIGDKIIVEPEFVQAHKGDIVVFRSTIGDMVLRFVNGFSDDGWVVRSNGGELSL
jgi:hypothetical protein